MAPPDKRSPPADADSSTVVEFDDGRASDAVVSAVSAATDADPMRMTPLYRVIEPDALDALIAHARRSDVAEGGFRWLSFRYEGHDVFVCSDGRVLVQSGE